MAANIYKGGSKLSRETGLHVSTVHKLQKDGMLPDEIRAHARELFAKRAAGKDPRWPGKIPENAIAPVGAQIAPLSARTYAPTRSSSIGTGTSTSTGAGADTAHTASTVDTADRMPDGPIPLDQPEPAYYDETHVQADRRKAIALADERELKVAHLRGELIPVATVNAWFGRQIVQCRDGLLKIGPDNRDRLAAETDPVKCEQIVDRAVRHVLEALRQMTPDALT